MVDPANLKRSHQQLTQQRGKSSSPGSGRTTSHQRDSQSRGGAMVEKACVLGSARWHSSVKETRADQFCQQEGGQLFPQIMCLYAMQDFIGHNHYLESIEKTFHTSLHEDKNEGGKAHLDFQESATIAATIKVVMMQMALVSWSRLPCLVGLSELHLETNWKVTNICMYTVITQICQCCTSQSKDLQAIISIRS